VGLEIKHNREGKASRSVRKILDFECLMYEGGVGGRRVLIIYK
jgi:hypothetical protein